MMAEYKQLIFELLHLNLFLKINKYIWIHASNLKIGFFFDLINIIKESIF